MKKLITLVAAATLVSGVSMSSFAAVKSVEQTCQDQAAKHKIAADKLDSYVSNCVKKHAKKTKPKASATSTAPAAPAAAPATADQ